MGCPVYIFTRLAPRHSGRALGARYGIMNYLLGASIGIVGAAIMFLPSVLGHLRHVRSFRNISAINALAALTLVGSLGSLWLLPATGLLWVWALVLAVACDRRSAQPTASPNGGPAERSGNSGVGGGPPSVS